MKSLVCDFWVPLCTLYRIIVWFVLILLSTVCVHGTYRKNLDSILHQGLKRMARLHVHFSSGLPTDGGVISGNALPLRKYKMHHCWACFLWKAMAVCLVSVINLVCFCYSRLGGWQAIIDNGAFLYVVFWFFHYCNHELTSHLLQVCGRVLTSWYIWMSVWHCKVWCCLFIATSNLFILLSTC